MTGIVKCHFCGSIHDYKCPMVKAYEYGPDGKLSRIEFLTVADFPVAKTHVDLPMHETRQ